MGISHFSEVSKKLSRYVSTMLFLVVAYLFYTNQPHFVSFFAGNHSIPQWGWSLTTADAFRLLLGGYAVTLIPYYLLSNEESSARLVVSALWRRRFGEDGKKAIRALALKAFFAPLMIHWLLGHVTGMVTGFYRIFVENPISVSALSETPFFVFAFQLILFADVLLFTLGYFIESKGFGNSIVSVDPTVSGWLVCLLCYPPFNGSVEAFLSWSSADTPVLAGYPSATAVLNIAILTLMAVYAAASLALGLKASNLTNRGIVSSGPYRLVRHPAYAAKNLAWWIGAVPVFVAASGDTTRFFFVLLSVSGWSVLYFLRAVTEERHLLMAENGYAEYAKKVPWRFIPGIW